MTAREAEFIVAISGSRGITDRAFVYGILDERASYFVQQGWWPAYRLGDAPKGVDALSLEWVVERGFEFSIWTASDRHAEFFEACAFTVIRCADWDGVEKKNAGRVRNYSMIVGSAHTGSKGPADVLISIWDGSSPGTHSARATAKMANIPIHGFGG